MFNLVNALKSAIDQSELNAQMGDIQNLLHETLTIVAVSMALIQGQLSQIQQELSEIKKQLRQLKIENSLIHLKLDSQYSGRLIGIIQACSLDSNSNDPLVKHALFRQRQEVLEIYNQTKMITTESINFLKEDKYKRTAEQYLKMMLLAGIMARNISCQLSDQQSTVMLTDQLQQDMQIFSNEIKRILKKPSALFWRQSTHIEFALQVRDLASELSINAKELRLLSSSKFETLSRRRITI